MDITCAICGTHTNLNPIKLDKLAPDVCFSCLELLRRGYYPYFNTGSVPTYENSKEDQNPEKEDQIRTYRTRLVEEICHGFGIF